MVYKYSAKYDKENMVKAVGTALPISTKQSIEICKWIRGKKIAIAKRMLNDVIAMKIAVPYTRFNQHIPHRPGIGPGRYPLKACAEILALIESVEVNAQFKGLDTSSLALTHICAQKAHTPYRNGRQGRRKAKRSHIEIIAAPVKGVAKITQAKKTESKSEKKKKGDK